jgi:hypothetical protein
MSLKVEEIEVTGGDLSLRTGSTPTLRGVLCGIEYIPYWDVAERLPTTADLAVDVVHVRSRSVQQPDGSVLIVKDSYSRQIFTEADIGTAARLWIPKLQCHDLSGANIAGEYSRHFIVNAHIQVIIDDAPDPDTRGTFRFLLET